MRYALLLVLLLAVSGLSGRELSPSHCDAIAHVMEKYEREFTLLEISGDSDLFLAHIPFQKRMIGELLVVGGNARTLLNKIPQQYLSSVSLMVPPHITGAMLTTLGRCEHFDIVVVHDLSDKLLVPYPQLISVLTALGDHVFMVVESNEYEEQLKKKGIFCAVPGLPEKSALYLSHLPKKGLDLARYTQKKERSTKPRYTVYSSYQRKEFFKEGLAYPISWVHGINLITFCMLYGVYPYDHVLRQELARQRKMSEEHNDLVIGNFILQGSRLLPIDSNDARRNSDPYNLLNVALDAFKRGNTRLVDPQEWINSYYQHLKS